MLYYVLFIILLFSSSSAVDATLRGDSPPRVDSISVGMASVGSGHSQDSPRSTHSPVPRSPAIANGNNVTHSPRSHRHRELPPVPGSNPDIPAPDVPARNHSSSSLSASSHHLPPPRFPGRPESSGHSGSSRGRGPISPPPPISTASSAPPPSRPHPGTARPNPVPVTSAASSSTNRSLPPPRVPASGRPPVGERRQHPLPARPSVPVSSSTTTRGQTNSASRGRGSRPAVPVRPPVGHTLSRGPQSPEAATVQNMISRVQTDGNRLLEMLAAKEPLLTYLEDYATLIQDMVEQAQATVTSGGGVPLRLCLANLRGQVGALRDSSTQNNPTKLSDTLKIVLSKTQQLSSFQWSSVVCPSVCFTNSCCTEVMFIIL